MEKNTEDWISEIVEKTAKKYNGRTIVLWGNYEPSYLIRNLLKERYGIDVGFFVDSDNNKVDDDMVLPISILKGNHKEYFVAIPIGFYQSLKNTLIEYGYTADDYYYFCDCVVTKTDDYYADSHGNRIIGRHRNAKIVFSGFNAVVTIGERFKSESGTAVYLQSNSTVSFGDDCEISGMWHVGAGSNIKIGKSFHTSNNTIIKLGANSKLTIGSECEFSNYFSLGSRTVIDLGDNSTASFGDNCKVCGAWQIQSKAILRIGNEFSINNNALVYVTVGTEMIVGNDCMFSYELNFFTNDAHSIFDLRTGKNINSIEEISRKRSIIIGNHVWIGAKSTILYNTRIGDGSIIGAGSVVKSKMPNNCIAAGVPARVVRRDIAWSRESCTENILDCGAEYIHMTEEL